jgi:DHA1 family tetracycline resistance protein-like MFS transporter
MPAPANRRMLAVLYGVVVVDLIGFGVVVPVLPFYAESLGASATVLGALLTCYAAMQFLLAPLWGRLSDRVGRRPVMLATIAGTAAALLLLGLADSLPGLFAARLLGGAFAANVGVASAYIADVTEEGERTRWMGVLGACFAVGFLLGPAIGGLLAPSGYAVPMLFAAGLAACNLVFALVVLREPERRRSETSPRRLAVLRDAVIRRLCAINFLQVFAVAQLETVFAFFMMDRFGYDAREVAFLLVAMAVVTGSVQGGAMRRLVARFGEKRLVLAGSAFLAAGFAGIPWMPVVPLLLLPLAVAAGGRGAAQPPLMGMTSLAAGPEERGAAMGVFQSSASLARVFGPLAAGALYDAHKPLPFLLASALVVLAAALALGVEEP